MAASVEEAEGDEVVGRAEAVGDPGEEPELGVDALGEPVGEPVGHAGDDPNAVLLDAPCSSTGTIRRHPDVAWTKSPQDVAKLAKLQFDMLGKAVEFVRPGGVLVFSNCSLLAVEGEALAKRAASEIAALEPYPVTPQELPGLETLVTTEGWLRSTPADMVLGRPEISGMDGFFAARFRVR